jgi:biotin synthase
MSAERLIAEIAGAVSPERGLGEGLALALEELRAAEVPRLFPVTGGLRRALSGDGVYLCSIVNAKSGRCGEDCRFCAQSGHWRTGVESYPLMGREKILAAAEEARGNRAGEFAIVTSGKGVTAAEEIEAIAGTVAGIAGMGIKPCISPGIVTEDALARWRAAGLTFYHHNLETAPSFFPRVCTTHDIAEDIAAVRAARGMGLKTCCGGIFGMGESWAQRVELALTLRELEVDSVPINFLNPIPGTPMAESAPGIGPMEALKTIALLRLTMPRTRLVLCGGRQVNLRGLQALMFEAGANALMIGNYLTTPGRPVEEDLQLLGDLGLEPIS